MPRSRFERLTAASVLACVAALVMGLYASVRQYASGVEADLSNNAQRHASELAVALAGLVGTHDRAAIARAVDGSAGRDAFAALVVVASGGDTLYARSHPQPLADRLLARGLERDSHFEDHIVASAQVRAQGVTVGRVALALDATPARAAARLRTQVLAIASSCSVLLLFSMTMLLRRLALLTAARDAKLSAKYERAEPAQAAPVAKLEARLLHGIGREGRSSLSTTIAMSELLLDGKLDPRQRRYAQTIDDTARGLLATLDGVLEFAAGGEAKIKPDHEEFDLRIAIEETVKRFAAPAHAKDLELIYRIESGVPRMAAGDEARLRQVLAQLIDNAVKFTERGEILVHAKPAEGQLAGRTLQFDVRDTGPGIPANERGRIFECFNGHADLLPQPNRGVGLGLAMAKSRVEAMGGQIGCDSTAGAGSCFWLTLPVMTTPASRQSVRPFAAARRALLLDQNRTAREALRSQVERWSIECHTSSSAYEAFSRIEQEAHNGRPFDLAIIAERTSDLSGTELLRAIRSQPAMRDLPIILLSNTGSALSVAEIESVAAAQLTRPALSAELYSCISRVLEGDKLALHAFKAAGVPRTPRPDAPRALVVDDNEVNQFAVVELLHELGFAPDVAHNGREAVEMVARHNYAIIFMDCEMPEMDGYEATREIRSLGGRSSSLPIIALTAHNAPEERNRGLAAGMDEYMAKPVRQGALEAALVRFAPEVTPQTLSLVPTPQSETNPPKSHERDIP